MGLGSPPAQLKLLAAAAADAALSVGPSGSTPSSDGRKSARRNVCRAWTASVRWADALRETAGRLAVLARVSWPGAGQPLIYRRNGYLYCYTRRRSASAIYCCDREISGRRRPATSPRDSARRTATAMLNGRDQAESTAAHRCCKDEPRRGAATDCVGSEAAQHDHADLVTRLTSRAGWRPREEKHIAVTGFVCPRKSHNQSMSYNSARLKLLRLCNVH